MKRFLLLAAILGLCPPVMAAKSMQQLAVWCTGRTNVNEVCQDGSGNIEPSNAALGQTLGTSALPWAGVTSNAASVNGPVNFLHKDLTLLTTAQAITPSVSYIVIAASGSIAETLTFAPTIATATAVDGQLLVFTGSGTIDTIFQDSNTLTNSALELGASTRAIHVGRSLSLIYNKALSTWMETGFEGSNH